MSTAEYFAANEARFLEEIVEFLKIPSISTDSAYAADVHRSAEWLVERLKGIGVPQVEMVETAWHPIVEAHWPVDPNKKTVLVYGHFDVQPVDPIELWHSDPFGADIRDGKIYARGSADMKINLLTFIQALEGVVDELGAPPLNLILIFEGEEEVGSSSLKKHLIDNADRLSCDAVLNLDSGFPASGVPGFGVSLKGGTGGQINIKTGISDLHSGMYGAAVPNANQIMATLAASFHTPDGKVAIDGFYDDVIELTDEERAEVAHAATMSGDFLEQSGAYAYWGEAGYTPAERAGARPTLDINGMWGGFTGEGAKTVTPNEAHLKLTCRLVANQDPDKIRDLIIAHIGKHVPAGIEWSYESRMSMSKPYIIPRDNWALQTAAATMADVFGVPPIFFRVGGSVPITTTFKDALNAESVGLGFSQGGSPIHAPNEWYALEDLPHALKGYAATLIAFGDAT
jgi:acetylornithine deacetylase/succinyl-diaminopimelate desuccinylase-like protein